MNPILSGIAVKEEEVLDLFRTCQVLSVTEFQHGGLMLTGIVFEPLPKSLPSEPVRVLAICLSPFSRTVFEFDEPPKTGEEFHMSRAVHNHLFYKQIPYKEFVDGHILDCQQAVNELLVELEKTHFPDGWPRHVYLSEEDYKRATARPHDFQDYYFRCSRCGASSREIAMKRWLGEEPVPCLADVPRGTIVTLRRPDVDITEPFIRQYQSSLLLPQLKLNMEELRKRKTLMQEFSDFQNSLQRYLLLDNLQVSRVEGLTIIDAPIDPDTALSEAELKDANKWMASTLPTVQEVMVMVEEADAIIQQQNPQTPPPLPQQEPPPEPEKKIKFREFL